MKEQSYVDALKGTAPTGAPTWKSARAFYLEVIRKEGEQVKAELAAVREERDEYAECFEEFKDLAYDARDELASTADELAIVKGWYRKKIAEHADARDELAAARAELRARDEAIADFDERARWRLAQKPYTGIGEP